MGAGSTYKLRSVTNAALGGWRGSVSLEFLGPKILPVKKAGERAIGAARERVAGLIRLFWLTKVCLFDETLLFDNVAV